MPVTSPFVPLSQPSRNGPVPALAAALMRGAAPGRFDELRGVAGDAAGKAPATPAWARFFGALGGAGLDELERRSQDLARQVLDNGITYNVYADASGPQRPWSVDLFPLLVDAGSWRQIEAGVLQRMRVLEAVMADVYGPQRLVAANLLPPALVHGHPGYLRGMRGAVPAGGRFLHVAAFDLARDAYGLWWVVAQRTQAPSGLGYLLENRALIARQFPEAIAQLQVRRLATSYQALVEGLRALAPASGEPPRIVLLTPGPYNETYFEHAVLARHLGLTLVEGADLTVRGERVYLRTTQGLEPVHAILKRLDDEFLDPLELRADSRLGVPGLLQAVRAGQVLVANAPGSALLESPALLGFLPALSEYLLGEALALPSLATWWCGERAALEAALPDLGRRVIKPTYGAPGTTTVLGHSLTPASVDDWARRLQRTPDDFTVQDYLPLSQMPTWDGQQIAPRSLLLRVFAMTDGRGGWQVLPGGLTRLAGATQEIASMQRGGSSVDTWVLGPWESSAPAGMLADVSLDPAAAAPQAHPHGGGAVPSPSSWASALTSRAAENLFWLGRYLERAIHRLQQAQGIAPPPSATAGIDHDLAAMRQAAMGVRDRLSPEHWRQVLEARDATTLAALAEALSAQDPQDEGWRLLATGRDIERMASQPGLAEEAWRRSDELAARLFTHADETPRPVGA